MADARKCMGRVYSFLPGTGRGTMRSMVVGNPRKIRTAMF
jgi:hypothetical protein